MINNIIIYVFCQKVEIEKLVIKHGSPGQRYLRITLHTMTQSFDIAENYIIWSKPTKKSAIRDRVWALGLETIFLLWTIMDARRPNRNKLKSIIGTCGVSSDCSSRACQQPPTLLLTIPTRENIRAARSKHTRIIYHTGPTSRPRNHSHQSEIYFAWIYTQYFDLTFSLKNNTSIKHINNIILKR